MPERVGVWERERDIGSGGFGTVVLWKNTNDGEKIAIKQCRWGEPGSGTEALLVPKVRERWQKEVEIMLKLNHRGIVRCMPLPEDFAVTPGALPRLCMEYCVGGDLRRVLLSAENCCGLPELAVRRFLSDITDAVGYLHGLRIIHRDLKPENVVLQQADGRMVYKLIDLGYAKELDQSSVCTSFVGTLQYLAPELFLTNKYTCTADYWSLGLVAHEVVTGVRPFLPNMLPAMWMRHVSQKGPDDICAEEMEDGSIAFRSEITFCNRISAPLRQQLERWLRRLLDWEPRRRGRAAPDDAVVVFDQLQRLLRRRVLAVYSVPAARLAHTEIVESTSMAELQQWIAAETCLPPERQELRLAGGGQRPDTAPQLPAVQCWAPPQDAAAAEGALLVFDRRGAADADAAGQMSLPPLVHDMLRDTEHRPSYYRQRAVYAQCVFLIQQQMRMLELRQKAQHAHMKALAGGLARLQRLCERLNTDLARLEASAGLFLASLGWDDQSYRRQAEAGGVTSERAHGTWLQTEQQVRRRLQQSQHQVQQLTAAAGDVVRRGAEMQRVPPAGQPSDGFAAFYEKACEVYDAHRRTPKEQRSRRTPNSDMIRIVVRFLRARDEPFRRAYRLIGDQQRLEAELDRLYGPITEASAGMARSSELIAHYQRRRQTEIWKLMEVVLRASAAVVPGQPPAAAAAGAVTDAAEPDAAEVSLASLLDSATLGTADAVDENLDLNAQIEELLKGSDPPASDAPAPDWSFLD